MKIPIYPSPFLSPFALTVPVPTYLFSLSKQSSSLCKISELVPLEKHTSNSLPNIAGVELKSDPFAYLEDGIFMIGESSGAPPAFP